MGWAMIRILAASRRRSVDVAHSYNVHRVRFCPAKLKPLLPLTNYSFRGAAHLPMPPDRNLSLDVLEGGEACWCRDRESSVETLR